MAEEEIDVTLVRASSPQYQDAGFSLNGSLSRRKPISTATHPWRLLLDTTPLVGEWATREVMFGLRRLVEGRLGRPPRT